MSLTMIIPIVLFVGGILLAIKITNTALANIPKDK